MANKDKEFYKKEAPKEKVQKERTSTKPRRTKMKGKDKKFWQPKKYRMLQRKSVRKLYNTWSKRDENVQVYDKMGHAKYYDSGDPVTAPYFMVAFAKHMESWI